MGRRRKQQSNKTNNKSKRNSSTTKTATIGTAGKEEEGNAVVAEEEARFPLDPAKEAYRLKTEEEFRLKAEEEAKTVAENMTYVKAGELGRAKEEENTVAGKEVRLLVEASKNEIDQYMHEEEARLKAEKEAHAGSKKEARLKTKEEANVAEEEKTRLKIQEEDRIKEKEGHAAVKGQEADAVLEDGLKLREEFVRKIIVKEETQTRLEPAKKAHRMSEFDETIIKCVKDPSSCVFLHPSDRRNYTNEELISLQSRGFEAKLFMTAKPCGGDTVFLRNHHTDNLEHASHFNYVRDYLKAAHAVKNQTCAKTTLTTLLTMCFDLRTSHYYTFALSLASGLSRYGKNTIFEIDGTMIQNVHEIDAVRAKFCFLMDIIFSKMSTKKFLLDDKQSNIFRLVHCKIAHKMDSKAIMSALFSFALQVTLTAYVALHQQASQLDESDSDFRNIAKDYNSSMLALAVFTFCYSSMVAMATIADTWNAYELVFKKVGLLMIMDVIINVCIPIILTYYGFILIICENDYIDAVLNCSALLFIPEIDDQLPQILGYQQDDIIKNFLTMESMEDFDTIIKMPEEKFNTLECARRNIVCGLQFGDFYITNMPEQGTNAQAGLIFQPYQVIYCIDGISHEIVPSTTVTPDCLLCEIEWQYTTGYPKTTNPRVGCLRLTKIDGRVVQIKRNEDPLGKVGINPEKHKLKGLFIITQFQMSEDVIKLRVCGSHNKKNFLVAFDYYSLWDVTDEARTAISASSQRSRH